MPEQGLTYTPPPPDDLGYESSLSSWVGPYVTDMLGRGAAVASTPYQAYTGPLTAGPSDLQQQAFAGIGGLSETGGQYTPTSFTDQFTVQPNVYMGDIPPQAGGIAGLEGGQPIDPMQPPGTNVAGDMASRYMNPFIETALHPQIRELRRDAEIQRVNNAGRLTEAGAYGGSRQAILDSELDRNLLQGIGDIRYRGYADAYDKGAAQYNTEEDRRLAASQQNNQYAFDLANARSRAGDIQRGIASEGIGADYAQFREERDYPFKQAQYMQSLLQELPLEAQSRQYSDINPLSAGIGTAGGIIGLLQQVYPNVFNPPATPQPSTHVIPPAGTTLP
jgi:hypothetical protein